jgi:hypothetical protein
MSIDLLQFQSLSADYTPKGDIRELPDTAATREYLRKLSWAAPVMVWVFDNEASWWILECGRRQR